ncbi:MAG: hypothetical protein ACM3SV_02020 [Betaproteobacteria bacterium]
MSRTPLSRLAPAPFPPDDTTAGSGNDAVLAGPKLRRQIRDTGHDNAASGTGKRFGINWFEIHPTLL